MRRLLALFALALPGLAVAKPMMPQSIPGDRLIANLEAMLVKHPKDAHIEYLLGRAHYAMFAQSYEGREPKTVMVFPNRGDAGLPQFPDMFGYLFPWNGTAVPKATRENIRHIQGASFHLHNTIALDPGPASALAHLTLACVLESSAPLAGKVTLPGLTTRVKFLDEAGREYLLAFDNSVKSESQTTMVPMFGLETLVSYESARSYLRVKPQGPRHGEVAMALAKFKKLPPPNAVTPLIFNLDHRASLGELLAPAKIVDFDLNGTGLPQRYSWVQSTTAFLVWDPEGAGTITSGRRLFGNATWWMLWSNAYEALDALDNNRDGWLTGTELKGLAIWIDRNQNGRAEPGEVTPLRATEIDGIATHGPQKVGMSPANFDGIRMRDGRLLPSYDWTTSPVKK
jgi:hypothetical protein